jgi:hypothetical protein
MGSHSAALRLKVFYKLFATLLDTLGPPIITPEIPGVASFVNPGGVNMLKCRSSSKPISTSKSTT